MLYTLASFLQVLFANTAGVGSMAAGRDLWVMAFLVELGVPLGRMSRLAGGFLGWSTSGCVVMKPEYKTFSGGGLQTFLEQAQLSQLLDALKDETTQNLRAVILAGRQKALAYFETKQIRLPDRQKLANALAKAEREGMLG
uniref:Uncharacterized protein n=1 Tax=Chrysotila carterae TaxID=13221 RepID=A0A6S9SLR0_CHRCT